MIISYNVMYRVNGWFEDMTNEDSVSYEPGPQDQVDDYSFHSQIDAYAFQHPAAPCCIRKES